MRGSSALQILGAADVTIARRGRVKIRGDIRRGQAEILPGGSIGMDLTGSLRVDGLIDVSGDVGGFVLIGTAGDIVLCEIATRLKAAVRSSDIVARLGGDEFAILSQHRGDADSPVQFATRLLETIKMPIALGDIAVEVGASIGIARGPGDGMSAEALLHAADVAMYRGKRDGRGTFRFFEQSMDDELKEQIALEGEFRLGERDVLLGEIEGASVYIGGAQFELWKHTQLVIDAVPGRGAGFSLEAPEGMRFLTRSRVFTEEEQAALDAGEPPRRGGSST